MVKFCICTYAMGNSLATSYNGLLVWRRTASYQEFADIVAALYMCSQIGNIQWWAYKHPHMFGILKWVAYH